MAPLTLEISSSIIYPKSYSLSDGSVTIDIATPPTAHGTGSRVVLSPPNAALKTGPEHPVYRLPQSISSGGLKVHLNAYVPPKRSRNGGALEKPLRRSSLSAIDSDNIIFEIAKASLGDAGADYRITNLQRDDGEGSYGKGSVRFTPGWFSGGTWEIQYVYKSAGHMQESRIDLKVDEGGRDNGIWKMTFPMAGIVAKEKPQQEGAFGENGRVIEIVEGSPGLEGWTEGEWRDFLTACWVTKVWNTCTRTPWLGASIRSGEGSRLSTW